MDFNNSTATNQEWNQHNVNTTHDIIHNQLVQSIFFMVYTTIFVLGIFGNVLVCYVVFRSRAMQTVTNLFITNLALSDILLCVLAVPFTPLYTFLGEWVFGSVICHLVSYAQGASVYISTLTLMSIAIDRFFVIIYPFHPRMKISTCIFIIVIIWVFSILVTLPYGVYMSYSKDNKTAELGTSDKDKYYCDEKWPSEKWRKLFGGFTTTMQFVFPFFIIKFCYICVSIRLNDRARSKPGSKNSRKEEVDRERKRRTNRMLIAMVILMSNALLYAIFNLLIDHIHEIRLEKNQVWKLLAKFFYTCLCAVVIFLISWLPLNLINLINDFYQEIGDWEYYLLSFFLVHALAMSSTCYNPFLYAWLNENFRKEFKQVLPCCDSTSRPPMGASSNWRSERTCNGNNETQQESLLQSGIHRAASIRERKMTPPPLKTDSVEVENILVPNSGGENVSNLGVVYDSAAETVRLRLITEEEPPPYDASMNLGE